MRQAFRGYHPPTDDELAKLWDEGLIVLDANALLHLFRYSAQTRDELIDLLKKYQDRIWIPHQVGEEFHRNRRSVPVQERKSFEYVESVVNAAKTDIIKSVDALQRPTLEADRITQLAKRHLRKVAKGLRKIKKAHLAAVLADEAHERTFSVITELYEGRVGAPYDSEGTRKAHAAGADRYPQKVPPGYADGGKNTSRKYGDLILWLQMLDEGKARRLPMLFITDDVKDDWWDLSGGYPCGPRAELVEEYYTETDERVHFYTTRDFLDEARDRGEDISDASVEEARKVTSVVAGFNSADLARTINAITANSRMQIADILQTINHQSALSEQARSTINDIVRMQNPAMSAWAREATNLGISASAASRAQEISRLVRHSYGDQLSASTGLAKALRAEEEERKRRYYGLGYLPASELPDGEGEDPESADDPD